MHEKTKVFDYYYILQIFNRNCNMIIKNSKELATNFRKKTTLDILKAGLYAAKPKNQ